MANLSEENQRAISQASEQLGISESAVLNMLVTTHLAQMVAAIVQQPDNRTVIDLVAIANELPEVKSYRITTAAFEPTDYWKIRIAAQSRQSGTSAGGLVTSLAGVRGRHWWDTTWSTEIAFQAKQKGITPEEMVLRLAHDVKGDR